MGLLLQIKDIVKSLDDCSNSLLALSVASKNADMFYAVISSMEQHLSLQEVRNNILETMTRY